MLLTVSSLSDLFGRKPERERAEITGELGKRPCVPAQAMAALTPSSPATASTVSRIFVRRRVFRLEHLAAEAFGAAFLVLAVLAGQHAAAKRRPGHGAEPERLGRWKEVRLGLPMNQTVLELRGRDRDRMDQLRQRDRASEPPSREVR